MNCPCRTKTFIQQVPNNIINLYNESGVIITQDICTLKIGESSEEKDTSKVKSYMICNMREFVKLCELCEWEIVINYSLVAYFNRYMRETKR